MAAAFRAVLGIDFDADGDRPAVRVEPGELLPPLNRTQERALRSCGAIERVDDDASDPSEPPSPDSASGGATSSTASPTSDAAGVTA